MALPVEIVREGIDWPAWVQAVGSVLALVFVLLAQRFDHANAERLRREDHAQAMRRAALSSITAAKFLTASIASAARSHDDGEDWTVSWLEVQRTDLAAALDSLRSIDRGSLPNEGAVVAVVNLIQAGHVTDRVLGHIEAKLRAGGDVPELKPLRSVLAGAEASLAQLRECWAAEGLRG